MTVQSSFDLVAFQRGYEEWDIATLLECYAPDVELVQIDRDNSPSSPKIRHGREALEGMFTHCASAGVTATVEHAVTDGQRAAATVTCTFPGGRRVVANTMLELRDGQIVCERNVVIGDQPAT